MSSSKNRVQAKIAEKYPHAKYIHCRSHVLNLAISNSCTSVPSIRNLFDDVQKLTWFLSGIPDKNHVNFWKLILINKIKSFLTS